MTKGAQTKLWGKNKKRVVAYSSKSSQHDDSAKPMIESLSKILGGIQEKAQNKILEGMTGHYTNQL